MEQGFVKPTEPVQASTGASMDATPPTQDTKVAAKFEVLMKREQAARQVEDGAKAKLQELSAVQELQKKLETAKKQGSPKEILELIGLSYEDISKSIMEGGKITPEIEVQRMRQEIEEFKNQSNEEKRKQLEDSKKYEQEREKQVLTNFKKTISEEIRKPDYIDSEGVSRYALTALRKQEEAVFQKIDEHYRKTELETGIGQVLETKEAADMVELELENEYKEAAKNPKIRKLMGIVEQKKLAVPRTLTNNLSTSQTPVKKAVTDEDRVQRAISLGKALLEKRAQQ